MFHLHQFGRRSWFSEGLAYVRPSVFLVRLGLFGEVQVI